MNKRKPQKSKSSIETSENLKEKSEFFPKTSESFTKLYEFLLRKSQKFNSKVGVLPYYVVKIGITKEENTSPMFTHYEHPRAKLEKWQEYSYRKLASRHPATKKGAFSDISFNIFGNNSSLSYRAPIIMTYHH